MGQREFYFMFEYVLGETRKLSLFDFFFNVQTWDRGFSEITDMFLLIASK
jgi:hypothetical protein